VKMLLLILVIQTQVQHLTKKIRNLIMQIFRPFQFHYRSHHKISVSILLKGI